MISREVIAQLREKEREAELGPAHRSLLSAALRRAASDLLDAAEYAMAWGYGESKPGTLPFCPLCSHDPYHGTELCDREMVVILRDGLKTIAHCACRGGAR